MGLKSTLNKIIRPFSKKANSSGAISNTYNLEDFLELHRLGTNTFVEPSRAYDIYNFNSSVSDAVDKIVQKTMNLTTIIKNKDGSIENEHDVLKFLENPNKLQTFRDFMETVATNYLLNKNSYIEITGNVDFKPIELFGLKNTWVTITEQSNSALYLVSVTGLYEKLSGQFILDIDNGRILHQTNLKELTHTKGFSLSAGVLQAVSILTSIEKEIGTLDQANNHNLNLLKKGFNGNVIITVDTEDQEGFEQFKKDIKNKHQGSGNAGDPFVLPAKEAKVELLNQTNRDMEYSKSKEMSQDTIYQRHDIPLPIVKGSAQSYNNYSTAQTALYDDGVFPLGHKIFSTLTSIFINRGMLDAGQQITFDISDIPALQLRRNEELKALRGAFILSINELRAIAGKEEVEGGDQIFVPSNLLSVAKDQFTDDNLNPPKSFIKILEKSGATQGEILGHWNDYKTAFRAD